MVKKKATWTVMVYLAGDNNLTSECLFALTEMKKADPGEHINVIAQFDPRDDHLPTQRYEINKNGRNSTLSEDIIDKASYDWRIGETRFQTETENAETISASRFRRRNIVDTVLADAADLTTLPFEGEPITDDTDTGSPFTLYNFLSFCINEYPADHYMIVLSGHAGGTDSDYLMRDDSSKGSLTFNEIKRVFQQLQIDLKGESIDIIGMDNCLMSMAEICYELRGLAQLVVGCESYSPASGWPYRRMIERLREDFAGPRVAKNKSVAAAAAKGMVEEYINYYSNYCLAGVSVAQSALDLQKSEKLKKLIDNLANALEKGLKDEYKASSKKRKARPTRPSFKDALVLAHWEAQSYNGEWFVDLYDFCDCLERRLIDGPAVNAGRALKRFISHEFVLKSCFSGSAYQYSYGVSIYFPWSHVATKYHNLEFNRNSERAGWLDFLKTYILLTRRSPRGLKDYAKLVTQSLTIAEEVAANGRMMSDRMMSDRMMSDRMMSDRMMSDRMMSDRMMSDRMMSDRMGSDRMMSDRMMSDRMMSDRMMSDRMMSDRMMSDRMMSDRMMSDRMMSDRMMSDRMMSDRMMSDRMMSDRMMSETGGNPIHSMRNPPVIFVPPRCIKEHKELDEALRKLFG